MSNAKRINALKEKINHGVALSFEEQVFLIDHLADVLTLSTNLVNSLNTLGIKDILGNSEESKEVACDLFLIEKILKEDST